MIRTCILVMVSGALACPTAGASSATHPWQRSKPSLKDAPSMRVTHDALADIDLDRLPPPAAGAVPTEAGSRMSLTGPQVIERNPKSAQSRRGRKE